MRLRNLKDKEEIMNNCEFLILDPSKYIGAWHKLFKNNNPIFIEIGMGMGKFIYTQALNNPDINYIGIERYDNVIARAIKKIDNRLDNLYLVRTDARFIDEIFDKEVDKLFLNFSDPWPKARHHLRRLSSRVFLEKYDGLFLGDRVIYQRTDNRDLYIYSLMSFSQYGYKLYDISFDLHSTTEEELITTEYEDKFSGNGMPIYSVVARK